MPADFVAHLREQNAPLWKAIHAHPFVTGIGDGSLSRERFEFYLKQDYAYLIEFSRVLALAAAKAETLDTMQRFSALLDMTLREEMELHRRTCAQCGISQTDLEQVEPAMITSAYTNFLLRTCYEGRFGEILAVLLPCSAGYVEIAEQLHEKGVPESPQYRDWIQTYTSPEMKEVVLWLSQCMNALASDMAPTTRRRCSSLYRVSARYELLFFDMAWERTFWPAGIPV